MKKFFYLLLLNVICANAQINNCVTGCNENTFVASSDPNTIEYDNIVSMFHTTLLKEANGVFKVWGQLAKANGASSSESPIIIDAANGFNYQGSPLKATGGSNGTDTSNVQMALLTTEGLYIWGEEDILVSGYITSSTAFAPVTIATAGVTGNNASAAKGLPNGVEPEDVKMLFGSYGTLVITTCTGEVWVLSFNGKKYGQFTYDSDRNSVWHRVYKSTTSDGNSRGDVLDNVVATRGTSNNLFALTSDGKLYTWGVKTFINSGLASDRIYATEVSLPDNSITPKMIGMTQVPGSRNNTLATYYLLAMDGRLFSMGDNSKEQLGNFSSRARSTTWVQVKKSSNANDYLTNVAWISPNEHDGYIHAAINVLTQDKKLWAWGSNSDFMIGADVEDENYNPIYMPGSSTDPNGMSLTDNIIAVETGGHTTINVKDSCQKYGYVGHRVSGSMGDGTFADQTIEKYSYKTAEVVTCRAKAKTVCYKPANCSGESIETHIGVSTLRLAPSDNWPDIRKGGFMVLESQNQGFVITRMTTLQIDEIAHPLDGMMVFDTVEDCLKIYSKNSTETEGEWDCFDIPACP